MFDETREGSNCDTPTKEQNVIDRLLQHIYAQINIVDSQFQLKNRTALKLDPGNRLDRIHSHSEHYGHNGWTPEFYS
jgi:hypothetical protein